MLKKTLNGIRKFLGFEVIGKFFGRKPTPIYFLEKNGVPYEFFQNNELEPACQGKVDHVSYVSDDIEKDYAYCVEQGYEFATEGIITLPTFWQKGCRYFKIKSPCGEQIEFNQIL